MNVCTYVFLQYGKSGVVVQLDKLKPYLMATIKNPCFKIKYIYRLPVFLSRQLREIKKDVNEFESISGLMRLY